MTLQMIAVILGVLALAGGGVGIVRPDLTKRVMDLFPRSVVPAWIFTALCCFLGAKEALGMNMGFLDAYKVGIYFVAPVVFVASVVYLKELLAPRAFGGFLLLIAVPILQIARWHESTWRLAVVVMAYLWIIYGILLLMSPWWFRRLNASFIDNPALLRTCAALKAVFGLLLLTLGIFVF